MVVVADVIIDPSKKRSDFKSSVQRWGTLYAANADAAVASIMSLALHVGYEVHTDHGIF